MVVIKAGMLFLLDAVFFQDVSAMVCIFCNGLDIRGIDTPIHSRLSSTPSSEQHQLRC